MPDVLQGRRLGVIGAGKMATALVVGLVRAGVPPASITCTRRRQDLLGPLAELGVRTTTDNAEAVRTADVVLLGVKPQGWREVVAECHAAFRPGQIVLSVLAGVTTERLAAELPPGVHVVRAMPNTPALVGLGATAWCARATSAEPEVEQIAASVFGASGLAMRVEERLMDAVTATSGSGPAYVFLLAEAMRNGAVSLGLDAATALQLVVQTFRGAAELLGQPGADPVALRAQVTSPKGSTADAIATLDGAGFQDLIAAAMEAGRRRAEELGRG